MKFYWFLLRQEVTLQVVKYKQCYKAQRNAEAAKEILVEKDKGEI